MEPETRPPSAQLKCPRCDSTNTKFCYYNNYSLSQPRHFCKACKRYWTRGGTLRNVPVGGGCRKNKRLKVKQPPGGAAAAPKLLANDPLLLPPPPSTSFPTLPPSAAVDDDGSSSSSMLYSLPALPSAFHGGQASCTSAAFDLHHHHHAAISSGAGVGLDDPVHQLHDEYHRLSGGEFLQHLPQPPANNSYSLLLQPNKSEEEEEEQEEQEQEAAARLLFDQQMMFMMNSTSTEWQIPMDQSTSLSQINKPSFSFSSSSSSSSSYAYLKEASSSIIGWPDAAAANYRWWTTTAAHRI